ncbi:MAG: hypothetical protein A2381_15190 [Bdellovibrionales bacterium RIFOXYB1_FULL_37_110]|nr:MAG: hypothetical protein A2381_15190 [Bdellovibrionales bacterium RIFOXYB1_FULL_37_110]
MVLGISGLLLIIVIVMLVLGITMIVPKTILLYSSWSYDNKIKKLKLEQEKIHTRALEELAINAQLSNDWCNVRSDKANKQEEFKEKI